MMRLSRRIGSLVALVLAGCTTAEQAFVSDVVSFDPETPARICMHHRDSEQVGQLKFFLRIDDRFTTDTLTVRVDTFSPDSLRCAEYHRLVFRPSRRINALKRIVEVPYRRGVRLSSAGDYYFTLTPTRSVAGVEAVGVIFRSE